MKKSFLLFAAMACTSLSLFAQTTNSTTSSPLSFGLKAGVNLATMTGDAGEDASKKMLLGLNAGVFATYHVSESFGIQPELTWSTLGVKLKEKGGNGEATLKMNYLTLPILAKYTFEGSGFSLYAGPQIGYLLSVKSKITDGTNVTEGSNKDGYKSTDFAGVAGLEFEIPNTKFNISGRYQLGLTKIAKGSNSDDKGGKLNAATFTVGYKLF